MSTAAEAVTHIPATAPPLEPDLGRRDYARAVRRVALALVGVGLAARVVRYAVGGGVWGDEAMLGLNIVNRDFAGLTRLLDMSQAAPVGFLWAQRAIFLVLGTSAWAVRLLPFLAGVGGLLLFWDFARRVVPPTAATMAVGVLAVSRWPVVMSGTLKPYAGDLFWSALLLALAARWRHRPGRLWPLVALALAVPFAITGSFPAVFVAGAVAVYLLPPVRRCPDRRAAVWYAVYALLMFAAFATVYRIVAAHQADPKAALFDEFMKGQAWAHGFPPADPLQFLGWAAEKHTGRMFAYPIGDSHGGSTLSLLAFVGGAWVCWRSGRRGLLVLCLTPFALNFVAAALGKYPYGACCRLSQHLAPAVCLLIGVGWAALQERAAPTLRTRLRWVIAAAVALAAFGVGQMAFDLSRPHRGVGPVWAKRIGGVIGQQLLPGDRVIYPADVVPRDVSCDWYVRQLGDRVSEDLAGPPAPETRRVWLVLLGASGTEIDRANEARLRAALGPGWVPLAQADYLMQPTPHPQVYFTCRIICMARDGDPVPRPIFSSFPQ